MLLINCIQPLLPKLKYNKMQLHGSWSEIGPLRLFSVSNIFISCDWLIWQERNEERKKIATKCTEYLNSFVNGTVIPRRCDYDFIEKDKTKLTKNNKKKKNETLKQYLHRMPQERDPASIYGQNKYEREAIGWAFFIHICWFLFCSSTVYQIAQ